MQLNDKVAIVTGGASGFGASIARLLSQRGAAVMIADLNLEGAERVAAELRSTGARASATACDVAFRDMVSQTRQAFGGLHILVNNAGTTHRNKPALEVTEDEFDRVYRVNLKSLFWSAHSVLPGFVAQGGGCIVNVASTTGVRPGIATSAASTSSPAA